jgi:hypothetical protein
MRRLFLVPLLAACSPDAPLPSEATWMHDLAVSWDGFNHRLSVLHARPVDADLEVAFIGGASTTDVVFDDSGTCIDIETCWELPFLDSSTFTASHQAGVGTDVQLAMGEVTVVAGPDGVEGSAEVLVDEAFDGEAVALIAGLRLDTGDAEVVGSCYDPRHGWLLRELTVTLGTPEGSGPAVTVPVTARFEGGASLEEERECLDAIYADGTVTLTVDIAVVAGATSVTTHTVAQAAEYDCDVCAEGGVVTNPPEQPLPDPVSLSFASDLVGWTSLSYTFHEGDTRGAYLRTLAIDLDVAGQTANGTATNFSPLSQQSGFDYDFEGTLAEVEADVELSTRDYAIDAMPATLDAEGEAVLTTLSAN